ncbi:testis, prostate and placenta-expressed protein [Protopterus annectens]|uniref:testis, prostate and placenta-expressed protein n=1 Tax=Protopterus annectens TaxID=7888 RepID=UPI001CF97A89|nr:testis, prostate and placenta-expressed protein [Protopterus annectens]
MATDAFLPPYSGSEVRTYSAAGQRALLSSRGTVKLAGVKEVLYHPSLPTLRRMDMDTVAHKLPDEHCRTMTACCPDDFKNNTFSLVEDNERRVLTLGITKTGQSLSAKLRSQAKGPLPQLAVHSYSPFHKGPDWSQVLAERGRILCPPMEKAELRVINGGVKYAMPGPPRSWRYHLTPEPSLDKFGQKPTPFNVNNRYRTYESLVRYTSCIRPRQQSAV